MIHLSREIRFALVAPVSQHQISDRKTANSWAGWPASNLIAPHLVLKCVVAGNPDPQTGYLINIKWIDDLLRSIVIDQLIPKCDGTQSAEEILQTVFENAMRPPDSSRSTTSQSLSTWPPIVSLTLALSPHLNYRLCTEEPNMIELTQQFEFSAAHRLHCDQLSVDENRELFGKCNNPAGHGHNYVIEVTVSRDVTSEVDSNSDGPVAGHVVKLATLEAIVKQQVIDRLDHKHLNEDIEYFASINPTVENIAIAIFNWLKGQFESAQLKKIRVYETPKTWAEYSG